MKYKLGLVSVSFRELTAERIVEIARDHCLEAIEWGGDIHVPSGNIEAARAVGELTRSSGLKVTEYGSYYRLGVSAADDIDKVVTSACALGTGVVRVWAYNKGSEEITADEYKKTVEDARRICSLYPELEFCTECHNNTLTDDYRFNLKLIEDVDMPNFAAFWQPNQHKSHEYNLESAMALAPHVRSVHVFAWEGNHKYPLERHRDRWIEYLKIFAEHSKKDTNVNLMLEFMHDNAPASLGETAIELKNIVDLAQN